MVPAAILALGSRMASLSSTMAPLTRVMGELGKQKAGDMAEGAIRGAGRSVAGAFTTATAAAKMLGAALIDPIKPLNLLSAAMRESTSGSSVYSSSVRVLTTLLGTVLTPAFLGFSVVTLVAASYISDALLPVLKDLYVSSAQLAIGMDGFVSSQQSLQVAWGALISQIAHVVNSLKTFSGVLSGMFNGSVGGTSVSGSAAGVIGAAPAMPGVVPGKPEAKQPNRFGDAFDKVIRAFELSNTKQADISSITEVSRKAQMALLNQNPIEAEMLKIQKQQLDALREAVAELQRPNRATVTAG